MNPRTCIVTRSEQPADEMIRFVLGPDNKVYPDLKRKLPGRGCWVSSDRKIIEEASSKGAFARGFKTKVLVDDNLPVQIEKLMKADALNMIALAKKAGLIIPGQAKAEAALRSGESELLLMATDAGDDGVNKMGFAVRSLKLHEEVEVKVFKLFSSDELDQVTGGTNVMHLAVKYGGMSGKLAALLDKLVRYLGEDKDGVSKKTNEK